MNKPNHIHFMQVALLEASLAEKKGDVPIGAVIVRSEEIISRAHNMREHKSDATAHAEIIAIRKACQSLDRWILDDCQLYVTLEPCIMCFGAIIQSRIPEVYFGAYDPKTGACGSLVEINNLKTSSLNHHTEFTGGILAEESSVIIKKFFRKRRK